MSILRRIWAAWQRGAHWLANKQSAVIYTILYFAVVGPIALLRRPFSDPLQYRKRRSLTFWVPREQGPVTLQAARRQ